MATAPTVLASSRQVIMGLPVFVGGVCFLAVASTAFHGLPQDTSTWAATAVFAVGTVASVIWALRWRHLEPARLTIGPDSIVMRGVDRKERTISRRPDSRLRVELGNPVDVNGITNYPYVIYDETVGTPRIAIDIYGVDAVTAACRDHGWNITSSREGH
jgi:hypothetical protein